MRTEILNWIKPTFWAVVLGFNAGFWLHNFSAGVTFAIVVVIAYDLKGELK